MDFKKMGREELTLLVDSLKAHLSENRGELAYWGEQISVPSPEWERGRGEGNKRSAPPALTLALSHSGEGTLEQLRAETVGDCHLCPLGDTRIKLVFGVGNPEAQVMFIGEGPGFDEDRKGEPFVGKAGQLLDKIMAAIGLDRTKVYIANVVKCHPMVNPEDPDKRGNDRAPTPEEMEKCLPFLKRQIEIIGPKILVTLGNVSTKALLKTTQGITSLRGRLFDFELDDGRTIKLLPTYHPAALLRDPELKKPVWEDMKKLRDLLSAPVS